MNDPTRIPSSTSAPTVCRFPRRYALAGAAVLAVVLVTGGAIFYEQLITPPQTSEIGAPQLVIPDAELNLGRVYETKAYMHVLHIHNPTDQPVTIDRFSRSCSCLDLVPAVNVTLLPGETKVITAKLALVPREPGKYPDGEPFEVELEARHTTGQPQHDAPLPTQERQTEPSTVWRSPRQFTSWKLKGLILPTIRLPATIHIGRQSDRLERIERTIEITAAEHIGRIDCEPHPDWSIALLQEPERASGRFQAVIRSSDKLTPRSIKDILRLTPVSREGERLPVKELVITGEIIPDVISLPQAILFGRQPCGTMGVEQIELRSLTSRKFLVKNVAASTEDLEITHREKINEGWIYSVQLCFTKPGEQESLVRFTVDDESGEYSVLVPVRYHGWQPFVEFERR